MWSFATRVCLLCAFAAPMVLAQQPAPTERRPFARFVERDDGGQLDVLVATYTKGDATLTLHAALHVADPEHYAELQKRFTRFDALLYELVADADLRPHPGMELEDDWFNLLQGGMGRGLGLVSQTDHIDYRPANFVHADMTTEQWEAALARARTSLIGQLMAGGQPAEPDREAEHKQRPIDLVAAFRSGRGVHELRIAGARLLMEPDAERREPTVLIEGRNERCLSVLQEQLAAGKKRLGIYYGAAHMEHLERRLTKDLGWTRTNEEWVLAWDNRASRFPTVEKGLQQKRYRARIDVDLLAEALRSWQEAHPGETPTWPRLREAATSGKLPGRNDGVDPWGRDYVLRSKGSDHEVRCLGSDGKVDTDDDVVGVQGGGGGDDDRKESARGVETGKRDRGLFAAFTEHRRRQADYRARPDAAQREHEAHVAELQREIDRLEPQLRRSGTLAGSRQVPARLRDQNSELEERLKATEADIAKLLRDSEDVATEAKRAYEAAITIAYLEAMYTAAVALHRRFARVPTSAEVLASLDRTKVAASFTGKDAWGGALRVVDDGKGGVLVKSDGPDGKSDTADDLVRPSAKK